MPNVSLPNGFNRQGSAFQELVVIPTLAPELARPYYMPGTPEYHAAEAERLQNESGNATAGPQVASAVAVGTGANEIPSAPTAQPVGAESAATPQDVAGPDNPRSQEVLFYVLVTLEWQRSERAPNGRSMKLVKDRETKQTGSQLPLFDTSRVQLLSAAVSAHGILPHTLVLNGAAGPDFLVHWKGILKTAATKVSTDAEWAGQVQRLRQAYFASKGKLTEISIGLNVASLEKYRVSIPAAMLSMPPTGSLSTASGVAGPGAAILALESGTELAQGTHVPSADAFSPETTMIAAIVAEIHANWQCAKHKGHCYVDAEGKHFLLSRFRSVQWANAISANQCKPSDPPPEILLESWGAALSSNGTPTARRVARGRTGNGRSFDGFDPQAIAEFISATVVAATSASSAIANQAQGGKKARTREPSSSPIRASSPPPAIENELDIFLHHFKVSRNVDEALITRISHVLHEKKYSPDGLCNPHLPVKELQAATGLEEGEFYTLLTHAQKWTARVDQKRSKRARYGH